MEEELKLLKFTKTLKKLDMDIFFIQEYSKILYDYFVNTNEYHISTSQNKDTMILARKSKFKKV